MSFFQKLCLALFLLLQGCSQLTMWWCFTCTVKGFSHTHTCICVCVELLQSCPTVCSPMDLQLSRLLCPWDSPGKNTGVGCHVLPQGIFPPPGLSPVSFLPNLHW